MNAKRAGSVQKMFKEMYLAVAPEPSMLQYINNIVKSIPENGKIDYKTTSAHVAVLAAAHYQLINKHQSLLLLNIPTLSYSVVNDPATMQDLIASLEENITISSIIDFRPNPSALATFKKIIAKVPKKKKTESISEHRQALTDIDSLLRKLF
jgi:hypothetical protein